MNRRLRLAGALVALLAFSAYFAEGVWAAACMPGMQDHAAEHASADPHAGMNHGTPETPDDHRSPDAPAHHGSSHGSDDAANEAGTRDAPDAPRCPLGMTGMGSSCVAASLPSLVDAQAPALESSTVVLPAADALHDSLFTASHFRPPRA